MTRTEAIKELSVEYLGDSEKIKEAKRMAIKALEQTRWIPVSERLPEKYDEYLCQEAQGFLFVDKWIGKWGIASCYCDKVVAWMPLPEPYKEESEGEE